MASPRTMIPVATEISRSYREVMIARMSRPRQPQMTKPSAMSSVGPAETKPRAVTHGARNVTRRAKVPTNNAVVRVMIFLSGGFEEGVTNSDGHNNVIYDFAALRCGEGADHFAANIRRIVLTL